VEYCNSCTERWPSCPKGSTGQCSWASPKRTCSPGESPSAEQSPTPRSANPPSSEQWSWPGNYCCANASCSPNGHSPYSTGNATCSPGGSPSVEQSPTPRPSDPPSLEQSSRRSESPSAEHHPPAGLANLQGQHNPPPRGPAIPYAQNNPPGAASPQVQNNPQPACPANLQAQNNPPPPGLANSQAQNVLRLGQKYRHPPANISAINHLALPMFIPGTPVRVQHAPANVQTPNNPAGAANLQVPNNPAGAANLHALNNPAGAVNPQAPNNPAIQVIIPARIQAVPLIGILGIPLGMQDAPPVDILGAAALIVEDLGFEYLGMARRAPHTVSDLFQISEFFATIRRCFFSTY